MDGFCLGMKRLFQSTGSPPCLWVSVIPHHGGVACVWCTLRVGMGVAVGAHVSDVTIQCEFHWSVMVWLWSLMFSYKSLGLIPKTQQFYIYYCSFNFILHQDIILFAFCRYADFTDNCIHHHKQIWCLHSVDESSIKTIHFNHTLIL